MRRIKITELKSKKKCLGLQLSGTTPVLYVQGAEFDDHQKIKGETNRNLLRATTSHKQIEFSKVSGYASKDSQSFLGKARTDRVLHTWSKGKVKTVWACKSPSEKLALLVKAQ